MELKSVDAVSGYKASVGEDGNVVLKKKSKISSGKKSKAGGGQFELRVRKDLEEKGWIVDKWSNNVDIDSDKMMAAKRVFRRLNARMGVMTIGTGFPDFVCFQNVKNGLCKVIGVEVKMNGKLSREEKKKCAWYLEKEIFSGILVASKEQERKGGKIKIVYTDFLEIAKRMRKKEN